MSSYRGAGVYWFTTRRQGLIGRLPRWLWMVAMLLSTWALMILGYPVWPALLAVLFNPREIAYIGETTAMNLRKIQHIQGGGRFGAVAKPWADLDPEHGYLPLKRAPKWALRSVETLLILLTWPVYNKRKNLWNPRRIPLETARRQRAQRDLVGWSFNARPFHLIGIALGVIALWGAR